jgi:FlaA1/EpsC-like NDP-sugar epimerase
MYKKNARAVLFDILCILYGVLFSYIIFYNDLLGVFQYITSIIFIAAVIVYSVTFIFTGIYRIEWQHWNDKSSFRLLVISLASSLNVWLILFIFDKYISFSFSVLCYFIITSAMLSGRYIIKYKILKNIEQEKNDARQLLIGAGEVGKHILMDLKYENRLQNVVGILDDDHQKHGKTMYNVEVLGSIKKIKKYCDDLQVNEIIISISEIHEETINYIIEQINLKNVRLKIIPAKNELISEQIRANKMRKVFAEDLLGRQPLSLNNELMKSELSDKTIFITGAGGSIGSEICHQILGYPIKKLVCLSRSEYSQYKLMETLSEENTNQREITYYLGNIRDVSRLLEITNKEKPDIIFHAAAHKHVPFMEENEKEAIKNNVLGTENVIKAAVESNAKKFILISTDKAVNPTNIMGASKRLAELLTSLYHDDENLHTAIVRFGNVLGSRGSVVPLFRKQILKGGPITVTHPDVVRYFMTIPEAALLVINCSVMALGGERFILDMGKPIKIDKLVRKMIRIYGYVPEVDIKIKYTGLRPGEKLYEELLTKTENISGTINKKIFKFKDNVDTDANFLKWVNYIKKNIDLMTNSQIRAEITKILPDFCKL